MTETFGPVNHALGLQRDRWTAISLLLFCWVLFAAIEQSPFTLQGAVIEALVERGRLHFVHGNIKEIKEERVFENLDTNTPSFRYLFNVFPHAGVYHVNHAPGQFLFAAPWYAACVQLGWRFQTHERLVWRVLVWTLTAPLGALAVMCLFVVGRCWELPWGEALLASVALAVASPWWPASGVLYHDQIAVAFILLGGTIWQCRKRWHAMGAIVSPIAAGFLLAFAVVTTYLAAPIVLLICGFILASQPGRRDALLFALAFVPTLAILPVTNLIAFGAPLATGYSAGGFDKNYPTFLDLANAWEKFSFYLWNFEYGLLWLFPVFFLGALGLILSRFLNLAPGPLLASLAAAHFLFIISMQHHGSVGWGMGRFFLPLYPVLALGLPAFWRLTGWKGNVARVLVISALLYSGAFAAAATAYGLQGVMGAGVWTLKQRVLANHSELYHRLFWIALIGGVAGEALKHLFCPAAVSATHRSIRKASQKPIAGAGTTSGKRRRKKQG